MSIAHGTVQIGLEAVDRASSVFNKVGGQAQGLGGKFEGLGQMAKIAGGMIIAELATRAMDAVKQFVSESITAFAEFESTLTTITAISGRTGEEAKALYEELETVAHEAGLEFAVGANEAAKALESLVKAGMDGAEAADALKAALSMARIEAMDTGEASDLLVGVMNQFRISASDSASAVDTLVNASVKGIGTASDFALGLSYCGSQAASMGFELEEVTAALVAINNQGVAAEKAGRYLGAMFSDLVTNADKLGFSLYDSEGAMLDLNEIIGKLTTKLDSFGTEAERNAYVQDVFSRQAGRAALALLNVGTESESAADVLSDLEDAMGKSGTAASIVGDQMDTLAGSQAKLSAATERIQILLGEALAPVIRMVADFATEFLIPAIEQVGAWFASAWDNVKPLADLLYWMAVEVINKHLIPSLNTIRDVLAPITDAVGGFVSNLGAAWNNLMGQCEEASGAIKEDLGVVETVHVETSDTLESTGREMSDSLRSFREDAEEEYDAVALKAEEMASAVKEAAEGFEEETSLMKAKASEYLPVVAEQFEVAFSHAKYTDAAEVIQNFAEAVGISFEDAETIVRDFIENEDTAFKARQEKWAARCAEESKRWESVATTVKTEFFDRVVSDSEEYTSSLQKSSEALWNAMTLAADGGVEKQQHAFDVMRNIIVGFGDQWGIEWNEAADILYDAVDRMEETALTKVPNIPKTIEEELLDRAQRDFEEFQKCISGKALTLDTDVEGSMEKMAGNITDLIRSGLVGEAQRQMEEYVNCSTTKSYDMVETINGYMEDLTESHEAAMSQMWEDAMSYTGEERKAIVNAMGAMALEYQDKMSSLASWKASLLDGMVVTTEEKFQRIYETMTGKTENAATLAEISIEDWAKFAKTKFGEMGSHAERLLGQMVETTQEKFSGIKSAIASPIASGTDLAEADVRALASYAQSKFEELRSTVQTKMDQVKSLISGKMEAGCSTAETSFRDMFNTVKGYCTSIVTKVDEAFKRVTGSATSLFSDLTGGSIWPEMWKSMIEQTEKGLEQINTRAAKGLGVVEATVAGGELEGVGFADGGARRVVIKGPLVNIEGSADEATALLAAELVAQRLRETVLVEKSSSQADTSRIRVPERSMILI